MLDKKVENIIEKLGKFKIALDFFYIREWGGHQWLYDMSRNKFFNHQKEKWETDPQFDPKRKKNSTFMDRVEVLMKTLSEAESSKSDKTLKMIREVEMKSFVPQEYVFTYGTFEGVCITDMKSQRQLAWLQWMSGEKEEKGEDTVHSRVINWWLREKKIIKMYRNPFPHLDKALKVREYNTAIVKKHKKNVEPKPKKKRIEKPSEDEADQLSLF